MEEKRQEEMDLIQWHPTFFADVQVELRKESEKLSFQSEYQLSKKPMEIDVLIIKKKTEEPIEKNIGRIFRKYNIVEYKSPTDYLGIDDFYKVYGYACFYKADTGQENEIPVEELTITFVSTGYPRKMLCHLEEERGYTIENPEEGIYYVIGDKIPIQVIVISRLNPKKNLWLYSLTNKLENKEAIKMLLEDYKGKQSDNLYTAVMQVVMKANGEQMKGEGSMVCEALMELMKDELEASKEEGKVLGQKLGEELGKELGKEIGQESAQLSAVKSLMKTLKLTLVQAMDALEIPENQRVKYRELLENEVDMVR